MEPPNLALCSCSSPPAQQLSFLRSGLLSNLYLHALACPRPLLQWLFQVRTAGLPLGGGSVPAYCGQAEPQVGVGRVGVGLPFPLLVGLLLGLSQLRPEER